MSQAKQRKSTLKTVTNASLLSLFIVTITACNDKEETSVTLTHPTLPAITIPTTANAPKELEPSKNDEDTLALAIPEKPPTPAMPEYPFSALALNSQLEKKFGRNVTDSNSFTAEGFYPLGWSKNGNIFAYASQYLTVGATDKSTFDVFIQDLVSDKIIWKTPSEKPSNLAKNINRWDAHKKAILAAFDKYNISLSSDFSLQHAPILLKKDTLSYKVKVVKAAKSPVLSGYKVLLKSSKKGIKKIANEHFKKRASDEVGSKTQVHIMGYLRGNNPNRIALLAGILEQGWEGTKTVRYKVIGASLTAGKWR
ncbi:MAG: hypothetical protein DSZ29_06610 [Aquificaceae bacterium]|nr:MAG: hypothetical protein DSZ29_06610 [Aquificaceae bacterium]